MLNADVVGVPAGGGQDEGGTGDTEGSGGGSELFLFHKKVFRYGGMDLVGVSVKDFMCMLSFEFNFY